MLSGATILGITNACLGLIATSVFSFILILGMKFCQNRGDISLMLTYNTCLAALLTCLTAFVMISSNLSNGFLAFNLDFCQIWGLLYDIAQCSIYHSYYLQALYRLCRVVFHKKRSLQSFSLYLVLIVSQWALAIAVLLPPLFLHWYVKIGTESFCLVPYTELAAEMYHIAILYAIPMICIVTIYIWITVFIRNTIRLTVQTLTSNQRRRNLRDHTIIKRIIMMVSTLVVLRFPTVVFMIYAVIVGRLYPFTFAIVGVITSFCLILIGLITFYITPKLRSLLLLLLNGTDNRVHTMEGLQRRLAVVTTSGSHTTPIPRVRATTQQYSTALQNASTRF
jgi:hypothetical protein